MAGLVGRTSPMPKTLHSPRHEALVAFLIDQRKRANVTQAELASKLGQYQSFVARAESGQRRIDVLFFDAVVSEREDDVFSSGSVVSMPEHDLLSLRAVVLEEEGRRASRGAVVASKEDSVLSFFAVVTKKEDDGFQLRAVVFKWKDDVMSLHAVVQEHEDSTRWATALAMPPLRGTSGRCPPR